MRHLIQVLFGLLSMAGAGMCWMRVHRVVAVEPIAEGEPATTSVAYYPPMMFLTLLLATAAGVLIVLGIAGMRRK